MGNKRLQHDQQFSFADKVDPVFQQHSLAEECLSTMQHSQKVHAFANICILFHILGFCKHTNMYFKLFTLVFAPGHSNSSSSSSSCNLIMANAALLQHIRDPPQPPTLILGQNRSPDLTPERVCCQTLTFALIFPQRVPRSASASCPSPKSPSVSK